VCKNGLYRPSWSRHAPCQSLTPTTQRTWIRTARYGHYSRIKRSILFPTKTTDLFEDVDSWLTPAVIPVVTVIQFLAPFVIYCVLVCCYGYQRTKKPFAKSDKMEDKAIAEKYKTQLDELESRTPQPENAITIAELRRIQQQLEEEVDKVRATRRQRDRKRRKTVKLCRIVSWYYYISFWLWVIYLITYFSAQLGQYAVLFGLLSITGIASAIYQSLAILIESCSSSERKYINNLSTLTSATERIESIRNTQPAVSMNAECYHYESRERTVHYRDAHGNYQSRTETYWEKVVTAFVVEPFLFTHWYDASQSTLTDVRKVGITKIKCSSETRQLSRTSRKNTMYFRTRIAIAMFTSTSLYTKRWSALRSDWQRTLTLATNRDGSAPSGTGWQRAFALDGRTASSSTVPAGRPSTTW